MKYGLKKAFDVNAMDVAIDRKLALATSALNQTQVGRNGIVKAEIIDGRVKFVVTATKEIFDNIDLAFNEASRLNISEVVSFGRRVTKVDPFGKRLTNKYGAFAGALDDIHERINNLTASQKALLQKYNIDVDALKNLELDIITINAKQDEFKGVVKNLQELNKNGKLHGITMINDDGARVLSFRYNEKTLNSIQANILMSVTGHDLTSASDMANYLAEGNVDKIASMFEKSEKRMRAFVSAREMSLADAELTDLVKKFTSVKGLKTKSTLNDIALIVDPQYEVLLKYALEGNNDEFKKVVGKDKSFYYRNLEANKDINEILSGLKTKFDTKELEEFRAAIRKFDRSGVKKGQWASDELEKYLLKEFAGQNQNRASLIKNLYKSIEQSYDGSDQMNRRFLGSYESMLRGKIKELQQQMPTLSAEQAHQAKLSMLEMKSVLDRIRNGELGQITGRGRISVGGIFFNIKNAFDATREFENELRQYGFVLNKFSLKRDTDIAGKVQSIILSGIGTTKDYVYADPVQVAFHPEVFADQKTLDAIEDNANNILREYRATIESGVVPDKIKRILERQAGADLDILPANIRASARRNKEFAAAVLDMLNSGISINDAPAAMSMLHNAYAVQAFREKGGFMQPVIPDLYRFAIDTEKAGSATASSRKLQMEKLADGIQGVQDSKNAQIMNFRIEGHKMLLPHTGPSTYFNSLGGFDLDDKVTPKLLTYTDNKNRSRLGFYLFRQPSGPEEVIFARAHLDQRTIKGLFDNTQFRDSLESILETERAKSTALGFKTAQPGSELSLLEMIQRSLDDSEKIIDYEKRLARLQRRKYQSQQTQLEIADLGKKIEEYKKLDVELLRNQPQLEETIVSLYEDMAQKGRGSIYRLTETGARRIGSKGSTLAISDLVETTWNPTKGKWETSPVNPKYTREGIYKALFDDGAFDMSQDILDVIGENGLDKSLIDQLKKAYQIGGTQDERFANMLKTLASKTSEGEANAILSAAKNKMQLNKILQAEGSLGQYVNRSMIIGSTLNQYEAFLNNLPEAVKKHMVDRYGIGMLAQETVIDMSVNFSRAKILSQETAAIIARQIGGLNEEAVGKSLMKLAGLGSDQSATFTDLMNAGLSNLGKKIGASRALNRQLVGEDLLLGIDEFLLTEKMSATDRYHVLEGMILGMKDMQDLKGVGTKDFLHDSLTEDLQEYQKVLSRKTDSEIKDLLRREIALTASHRYASLSKIQSLTGNIESYFENVRRAYTARISTNPALMTASTTAEERAAAKAIIDNNKDALEEVFGIAFKERKNFSASQTYDLALRNYQVSEDLMNQIKAFSEMENTSFKGLITSIDRHISETGMRFDLGMLKSAFYASGVEVSEDFEQFMERVWQARKLQKIDFYEKFDQQNAVQLLDRIRKGNNQLTVNQIKKEASKILDDSTQQIDPLQENILKALTGRASEIENEMARQQAQLESNILEFAAEKDLMGQGTVDSLQEVGKATELTDRMRSLGVDDELMQNARRSLTNELEGTTVKKAKYKRLTKKIFKEDKDLIELMKNPMVRKGAIGLGALVLGSFAYSAIKDRTVDDVKGPPLLPGGSAYESDYPVRGFDIGNFGGQGYTPGVNYRVNLYGDRNQVNQLSTAAGGLANGNISTTMYNRIPDVGRDQYSELASMF